jgi:hypothetical protein
MTRSGATVVFAIFFLSSAFSLGCAPRPGDLEPLPRHPFPKWVQKLETGKSDQTSVRERFGEPDVVEQTVMGGRVWRYRFAEVQWPDTDPDRPDVGDSIASFGEWLDWLMFYPPKQPRPATARWLPATIHDLELDFDLEGRLVRYRYAPEPGRAPIPREG